MESEKERFSALHHALLSLFLVIVSLVIFCELQMPIIMFQAIMVFGIILKFK